MREVPVPVQEAIIHGPRDDRNWHAGRYGHVTPAWINWFIETLASNEGAGRIADLPTNLDRNDRGYRFFATEYRHTLVWSGYNWEMRDDQGAYLSPRLTEPITHSGTVNTNGTAVTWVSGPRFEAEWGIVNRIRINSVWYSIASINSQTGLTLTTSAGSQSGVSFEMFIGWHFCDGKGDNNVLGGNVAVLRGNGTIQNIVVPDLTNNVYMKFQAAASLAVNPPVAPTLSGNSANEAAHTHSIEHDHPIEVTNTSGSLAVQAGTGGEAVGAHSHAVDLANFIGNSGAGSAHNHGVGTYVISTTGEPRNIIVGAWMRK